MSDPQKPSPESLLMEMIANQQSIGENVEAVYERLTQLENRIESAAAEEREEEEFEEDLYEDAKEAVIEAGKASTSYLQRKLRIGYSRAAGLMDMLTEEGVIGPQKGSEPREVLVKE